MSSQDMARNLAIQASHQPSPPSDPNIDMILQSLMIDDTDVKRILKGEIQEPLNRFRELNATLANLIVTFPAESEKVASYLVELKPLLEQIEFRLARYYHNVPYLLLLSPLTRLSNLEEKQAEAICRKIGIMIGRDKLMMSGDEDSFENLNFYDALYVLIYLAVNDSVKGFKAKIVTEEKKTVNTVITDTGQQRKKRFGMF